MSQTDSDDNNQCLDNSFADINWMSLWQTSGNDWSWMLEKECIPSTTQKGDKRIFKVGNQLILVELLVSFALLALAIALRSFPTPQPPKAIDPYILTVSTIHRYDRMK